MVINEAYLYETIDSHLHWYIDPNDSREKKIVRYNVIEQNQKGTQIIENK